MFVLAFNVSVSMFFDVSLSIFFETSENLEKRQSPDSVPQNKV